VGTALVGSQATREDEEFFRSLRVAHDDRHELLLDDLASCLLLRDGIDLEAPIPDHEVDPKRPRGGIGDLRLVTNPAIEFDRGALRGEVRSQTYLRPIAGVKVAFVLRANGE
jgi:hypothetical protein